MTGISRLVVWGFVFAGSASAIAEKSLQIQEPIIQSGQEPIIQSGQGPIIQSGQGPIIQSGQGPIIQSGQGLSDSEFQSQVLIVDVRAHCLQMTEKQRPVQRMAKLQLKPNRTYTVVAQGEAFFSEETGSDADPVPGVILSYCDNSEDGFAVKSRLLSAGESFSFTTPKHQSEDLWLRAFFMDYWPGSENRGQYKLTLTESPAKSVKVFQRGRAGKEILNMNFANELVDGKIDGVVGEPEDYWNFIEYGQQHIKNAKFADGTPGDIEIHVSPNDGEWGITSHIGVYHGYIYHNCRCVDLSVEVKYLPAGIYEVYVFAHGDAPHQNAAVELECAGVKLKGKSTLNDESWDFRNQKLTEGNQYVRYVIEVTDDSPLNIISRRDGSEYSMLNAIQLKRLK